MAGSKEAIAIVLDVGQFMALPANEKNDTFLDLACDCINWIVSRKIFTESKDELSLVLFGCDDTKNPLAEDDQYQNIVVARELQLPDFDFIRFIQNEIRPSRIGADWLDALVVAIEALREGTEGKKFGLKSITLFSNLGGEFSEDQHEQIATVLKDNEVELNIIGPDVRLIDGGDSQSSQPGHDSMGGAGGGGAGASGPSRQSFTKKTPFMKLGEKTVRKIYALGVDGECYTPK